MPILEEFKKHPAIALIFLAVGFAAGIGTYKYLSGFFNSEVVMVGSYIYKTEIEKTHVPMERYAFTADELKTFKFENESLKKQNNQLLATQSAMSDSVCQRFAADANSIVSDQQSTERTIQTTLSIYEAGYRKNDQQLEVDSRRAMELRKYSEYLNQQLMQVRDKIEKCLNK